MDRAVASRRTPQVLASIWDFRSEVGSPEAWKAKLRGRKVSGVCKAFGRVAASSSF